MAAVRLCDECSGKMPPYVPRKRVEDKMLCEACAGSPRGGFVSATLKKVTAPETEGTAMSQPLTKAASFDEDEESCEHCGSDGHTTDEHGEHGWFDEDASDSPWCPKCEDDGHGIEKHRRSCRLCGHDEVDGDHDYPNNDPCPYARKGPNLVAEGEHDEMKYCDSECQNNHAEDLHRGIVGHHVFTPGEREDGDGRGPSTEHTQDPYQTPRFRGPSEYEYRDPSKDLRCHYCRSPLVDVGSMRQPSTEQRVIRHAQPPREAAMHQPLSFEAVFTKVAHDSGDGETIYHCPFCGSGQVIARSDKTIECEFCHTCFTVQVQPQYSAFPQTVDGVPVDVPGMPGQIGEDPTLDPLADPAAAGEAPPFGEDPEAEEEAEEGAEEPEEEPKGNPFTSARLSPADLAARLALRHTDDRESTLMQVRQMRRSQRGH